ncbi:MAG: STAS domain-containing protein [Bacillota bacterium]|nr:STAS domain-containing protein [Bacillota bacterium]
MNNESNIVRSILTDGIQVISLSGRMTYDSIHEYKDSVIDLIVEADGYILDLNKIVQIDSTGLGLLVNIAKYFIKNKNKMVILNTDELIIELFKISKLDEIFEICDSRAEAIKIVKDEDNTYWSRVMSF